MLPSSSAIMNTGASRPPSISGNPRVAHSYSSAFVAASKNAFQIGYWKCLV